MTSQLTISELRSELKLTQSELAERLGLSSKGNVSLIERGGACSVQVALKIEELSDHRIDAGELNEDVAAARHSMASRPDLPCSSAGNSGKLTQFNEPQEEAA